MVMANFSNMTDFGQLPQLANDTTGGIFWSSVVFLIWIILIFFFSGYGFEVALLASSFLALIISILLSIVGVVAWPIVLFFAAMVLLLFLYITYSKNGKT